MFNHCKLNSVPAFHVLFLSVPWLSCGGIQRQPLVRVHAFPVVVFKDNRFSWSMNFLWLYSKTTPCPSPLISCGGIQRQPLVNVHEFPVVVFKDIPLSMSLNFLWLYSKTTACPGPWISCGGIQRQLLVLVHEFPVVVFKDNRLSRSMNFLWWSSKTAGGGCVQCTLYMYMVSAVFWGVWRFHH